MVSEKGLREKFPKSDLEGQRRQQRKRKKMKQYELCHYLHANGLTQRRIARIVGLSRGTVIRYLRAETFPKKQRQRLVSSILDPFLPYLEERFQAGCHNASLLWREIKAKGYSGSPSQVRKWVRWRRKRVTEPTTKPIESITPIFLLPPASDLHHLLTQKDENLSSGDKWLLERVTQIQEIGLLRNFVQRFRDMIQDRDPQPFDSWLADVKKCALSGFVHFAAGLEQDYKAVRGALTYQWSNGQTEGQVNRLKMLKRQMFGRAKVDLLRKRIMYPI